MAVNSGLFVPAAFGKWPDQPEFVRSRWSPRAESVYRAWEQQWRRTASQQLRQAGQYTPQRDQHWYTSAQGDLVWAWPSHDSHGRSAWWVWLWLHPYLPERHLCEQSAPSRDVLTAAELLAWSWTGIVATC